jgi:hypothetical protein
VEEPARLRNLRVDDLATEMGGVQQGAPAWSKYVAEFERRRYATQRFATLVAVGGVIVSALAIVVGALSSIGADRAVSQSALNQVSRPCRLPTLPVGRALTISDLEVAYIERGEAILACDKSRETAVEIIRVPVK